MDDHAKHPDDDFYLWYCHYLETEPYPSLKTNAKAGWTAGFAAGTKREEHLKELLREARKYVRGRHSTFTHGPISLLERIDAALGEKP